MKIFWSAKRNFMRTHKSALLIYSASLLLCISLIFSSTVQWFSLRILDQSFQLQRTYTPKALAQDVVVIGIDEQTYASFPEPFALWHAHLGELFRALAIAKPSVVGLDFSFPDRSYDSVLAESDKKLLTGILALKQVAPLVLGITIEQSGMARKVYPPFLSVAGEDGHAYVLWQLESDRVVRQFKPIVDQQGHVLPTLVGTMAKHLKLPMEAGYINFALGEQIQYLPLQHILALYQQHDVTQLQKLIANKPVIIGTVLPFEDRHYQPVNLAGWEQENANFVPGMLIHVQALRSVMHDGFIKPLPTVIEIGITVLISLLWWSKLKTWQNSVGVLILIPGIIASHWFCLAAGFYLPVAALILAALLMLGSRTIYDATLLLQERRRLKGVFSGYVGPNVMQEIIHGRIRPGVHGERKHICVLFSDIRSFTSISEKLQPEQVISFLNLYLDAMVNAIQQHEGTVDKFMGDGIMAFFGAPNNITNPCQNAFAAAKAKLSALEKLNRQFATAQDFPQLHIGIGLHVGDAVVGNIGSTQRNEFTAIGDVVNTGSRLEGLTKQLGYSLIVSDEVYANLIEKLEFDDLGEIPVKGRAAVKVYGWPGNNLHEKTL